MPKPPVTTTPHVLANSSKSILMENVQLWVDTFPTIYWKEPEWRVKVPMKETITFFINCVQELMRRWQRNCIWHHRILSGILTNKSFSFFRTNQIDWDAVLRWSWQCDWEFISGKNNARWKFFLPFIDKSFCFLSRKTVFVKDVIQRLRETITLLFFRF